jgi:hypothetical protein
MASRDILSLSSSPRQFTSYHMSSSPLLPSPSEIFRKKSQNLCTGSRAAPILQNATATFTSPASLLKNSSLDSLRGVDVIQPFNFDAGDGHKFISEEPSKPTKSKTEKFNTKKDGIGNGKVAKTSRKAPAKKDGESIDGVEAKKLSKPRLKKDDEGPGTDGKVKARLKSRSKKTVEELADGVVKEKAPRKPRTKKVGPESVRDDPAKEIGVRKPRTKKVDGEIQSKISKGQVTKPSSWKSEKVDGVIKSKKADSVSKHFTTVTKDTSDPFVDHLDHGLVEAVKRRTDWTPPVPTTKTALMTTPIPIDLAQGEVASGGSVTPEKRSKGFTDLFSSFGFNNLESNTTKKRLSDVSGTRKRKLIELVKTNVSTTMTTAAPKVKAAAKKARTITDLATSAYAQEDESPNKPAPLLQYFSYQTSDRAPSDGFKLPQRPRPKSPVKAVPKTKKRTALAPILLSPESALKQVGNQDFVFGTSSQLAREESPTLLRDLHEAMQASNEIDVYDPLEDAFDEPASKYTFASRGHTIPSTKCNLWSAAARDTGGELLDIEMVDLADSPAIVRQDESSIVQKAAFSLANPDEDDVWHDVDRLEDSMMLTQKSTPSEELLKLVGPVEVANRSELSSSPPNGKSREAFPNSRKLSSLPKASRNAAPRTDKTKNSEKPNYASYSTLQLAKEVATYRFKPVKSRDKMITLLEKCWEGKHRTALGVLGTNAMLKSPNKSSVLAQEKAPPSSQVETASPMKRGRPRKDGTVVSPSKPKTKSKSANSLENMTLDSNAPQSKTRTSKESLKKPSQSIEDISDSDTPLTSPLRRHPLQIRTPQLHLHLLSADVEESPEISPASSQAKLCTHITRAITTAPPSKDPSKPSWHEKILLYDPIVLEDLTVWLNTGALEKAGWDGEVEPKEVKKWCEMKSICCLWKDNLRGAARSRY